MLSVGVQDTIGFEYRALNSDVKFRILEWLSKSDLNAFESIVFILRIISHISIYHLISISFMLKDLFKYTIKMLIDVNDLDNYIKIDSFAVVM